MPTASPGPSSCSWASPFYLDSHPDLRVWHETILDAEFTADTPAQNFADYLALEERLFEQLDALVYAKIQPEDRGLTNRYRRDSLSDPGRWPINWNRSFELPTDAPRAGVLLLHGMSDSPYSLRGLGESLHDAGARVIGLRLPGHGTAPSGLVEARWQDMAAAVRLAVLHLREQVGQQPLYIVGYSNGGALAVHYALLALADDNLPAVDGLVLISPAIGVTSVAALAVWQARLGHLLGLDKLAWNSILLEYDPFKYNSFAVNAGDQVYRLTAEIQRQLDGLSTTGLLQRLPPILAFQSVVDATVSTPALVEGLFGRLPAGDHELVLFDINRLAESREPVAQGPESGHRDADGRSGAHLHAERGEQRKRKKPANGRAPEKTRGCANRRTDHRPELAARRVLAIARRAAFCSRRCVIRRREAARPSGHTTREHRAARRARRAANLGYGHVAVALESLLSLCRAAVARIRKTGGNAEMNQVRRRTRLIVR